MKTDLGPDLMCRTCEEVRTPDLAIPLRDGYRYVRCGACGTMVLDPAPSDSELPSLYDDGYYEEMERPPSAAVTRALFSIRLYERPEDFAGRGYARPGKVLDIGCGTGRFLSAMARRGWHAYGVDISAEAVEQAERRLGPGRAWAGDLRGAPFDPESFDLVTMWHVLEHVPHPRGFVAAACRLLRPGGRLVLEVPNARSWVLRGFGRHYAWIMVPEHILYLSAGSIRRLFEAEGLHVERVRYPLRGVLNLPHSMSNVFGRRLGGAGRAIGMGLGLVAATAFAPAASVAGASEVVRITGRKP